MTEKMTIVLVNGFILLLILGIQLLIPNVSRKDIILGVRIPEDKKETKEIKEIISGFRRENLIVGLVALIFISLFLNSFDQVILLTLSPLLYIGILFIVYLRWNKKTIQLKKERNWKELAKNVVVVDSKFTRDKAKSMGISWKWYIIPLIIIIVNVGLALKMYPTLADRIPSHWDFQGNVDGYMNKSILTVLMMPITQVIMAIIIYCSQYFIIKSKQQIDGNNPEISLKKNMIFRKTWSIYLLVTLILLEILFTIINLMILGIISNQGPMFMIFTFIVTGLITIGAIVLSVRLGQGGDRLKISGDEERSDSYDIEDDNLWKLGNSIYYNPEDPSIFVEKRTGVGWTVNGGRPIGMFLLILPFIIIIATLFLVK